MINYNVVADQLAEALPDFRIDILAEGVAVTVADGELTISRDEYGVWSVEIYTDRASRAVNFRNYFAAAAFLVENV